MEKKKEVICQIFKLTFFFLVLELVLDDLGLFLVQELVCELVLGLGRGLGLRLLLLFLLI